jgi:hypothetical protein
MFSNVPHPKNKNRGKHHEATAATLGPVDAALNLDDKG